MSEFLRHHLLLALKHEDDPFKGKWQLLHEQENATCVAFSPTGDFIALGTSGGEVSRTRAVGARAQAHHTSLVPQVHVWDCTVTKFIARKFRVPVLNAQPASTASARAPRRVGCVAWSDNSALLFAGAGDGTVAIFSSGTAEVVRVFNVGIVPRFLKPHPALPCLLVVPHVGLPVVLDWVTGTAVQLPESLLPPPAVRKNVRAKLLRGAATRCDAVWVRPGGRDLLLYSSRGELMKVRCGLTEARLAAAAGSAVIPTEDVYRVVRLSYVTPNAAPVLPPEMRQSAHAPTVMLTTRDRGLILYNTTDLRCVDRGYAEPVDNTVFASGRFGGPGDKYIFAVPSKDKQGRATGGLFAFPRGALGVLHFRRGPSGSLALLDVHPRGQGMLVAVTLRGQVFTLQQPFVSYWAGPMYPPGFSLLLVNKPYQEREDEYDLIDEAGTCVFREKKEGGEEDEEGQVDVVGSTSNPAPLAVIESGQEGFGFGQFLDVAAHLARLVGPSDGPGAGAGAGAGAAVDVSAVGAHSLAMARQNKAIACAELLVMDEGAQAVDMTSGLPLAGDGDGDDGMVGVEAASNPFDLGIDTDGAVIFHALRMPDLAFMRVEMVVAPTGGEEEVEEGEGEGEGGTDGRFNLLRSDWRVAFGLTSDSRDRGGKDDVQQRSAAGTGTTPPVLLPASSLPPIPPRLLDPSTPPYMPMIDAGASTESRLQAQFKGQMDAVALAIRNRAPPRPASDGDDVGAYATSGRPLQAPESQRARLLTLLDRHSAAVSERAKAMEDEADRLRRQADANAATRAQAAAASDERHRRGTARGPKVNSAKAKRQSEGAVPSRRGVGVKQARVVKPIPAPAPIRPPALVAALAPSPAVEPETAAEGGGDEEGEARVEEAADFFMSLG